MSYGDFESIEIPTTPVSHKHEILQARSAWMPMADRVRALWRLKEMASARWLSPEEIEQLRHAETEIAHQLATSGPMTVGRMQYRGDHGRVTQHMPW